MIGVVELPDGRPTLHRYLADFAGGQDQRRPSPLTVAQASPRSGRAAQPTALARLELDVMQGQTGRNVPQRHAIARRGLNGFGRTHDHLADRQALWRENVPLGAIRILQQRDMAGAIGVVLDADHRCGHVVLGPSEVDEAVSPLVSLAPAAHRDLALVVPPAGLGKRAQQGLFRPILGDLRVEVDRGVAPGVGRRFVEAKAHGRLFHWPRESRGLYDSRTRTTRSCLRDGSSRLRAWWPG